MPQVSYSYRSGGISPVRCRESRHTIVHPDLRVGALLFEPGRRLSESGSPDQFWRVLSSRVSSTTNCSQLHKEIRTSAGQVRFSGAVCRIGSISTRPSLALATTSRGMLRCRHSRMSGLLPLYLLHRGCAAWRFPMPCSTLV